MRNAFISLIAFLLLASCRRETVVCDYIITHVTVIDVEKGVALPGRNVAIKGEKIVRISEDEIESPDPVKTIDGTGKYLMPGLWDMHVHYWWNYKQTYPLLIANGVVGVREMFGNSQAVAEMRKDIKGKMLFAPEIVSSGPIIDGVPAYWEGSDTVTVTARAAALIDRQMRSGADFLKVYSGLQREVYFELARIAKQKGIVFAGHTPDRVSIYEALEAGQKSSEHLYGILEACTKEPSKLAEFKEVKWGDVNKLKFLYESFDERKFDSLLAKIARSETWLCPTLVVLRSIANLDDSTFRNDARNKYLPAYMTDAWNGYNRRDTAYFNALRKQFELQKTWMKKMQRAGVKLLAGTDFSNPYCYPGFSLHDELALMTEGGLSPTEALRTATLNPAIYMQKEKEYGTVAEGKTASLVLLNANPLENIRNTQQISSVFLKGKFFSTPDIRSILRK